MCVRIAIKKDAKAEQGHICLFFRENTIEEAVFSIEKYPIAEGMSIFGQVKGLYVLRIVPKKGVSYLRLFVFLSKCNFLGLFRREKELFCLKNKLLVTD